MKNATDRRSKFQSKFYSGRDDVNHREGVGILMSRSAARALMDWTPISKRIIQAWFYSQHIKLTIILCTSMHSLTDEADEQVKEEFCMRL